MTSAIAFAGDIRLAAGMPADVAVAVRRHLDSHADRPVLIFDAETSRPVEFDLRGSEDEIRARLAAETPGVARGRPKLGVAAREITLLPRQWDWLATQRGGASATLRKLVSDAQRESAQADARRQALDSLYRFLSVMAGNRPGFEEAARALFTGDEAAFRMRMSAWPDDIQAHASTLAAGAFVTSELAPFAPPTRLEAVETALRAVLGDVRPAAVTPLTAGASAAVVLKIDTDNRALVLRLDHPGDGFRDPPRQYACHAIAAQAQVAPRLLYSDAGAHVSVCEFVTADNETPREVRLTALARSVRKLHATPLFPPLVPFLDGMAVLLGTFTASGIVPTDLPAQLNALLARIVPACRPAPDDIVSSHNDLNPNNILFAGDRAWLVDWESAFCADRYVDLATVVNFFGETEAERELILTTYFGRAPLAAERARLELMRQVSRIFYGVMLLSAVKREDPAFTLGEDAFAAAAASRPAGIATTEARIGMACGLLTRALEVAQTDAFERALLHTDR
jgi:hypothetical protein